MNADIIDLVDMELDRAIRKFPNWPTDPLHALAVLQEEVGELQKHTLEAVYEPHKSTEWEIKQEAIQVLAMAYRFVLSLPNYEYKASVQHRQFSKE